MMNADNTIDTRRKAKADHHAPPPKRTTPCPACHTLVSAEDVDSSMLRADAPNQSIEQAILARRARRAQMAGDLPEVAAQKDVAERLRHHAKADAEDRPAQPGSDICPACTSKNITVDESMLSSFGRRELRRSRQRSTDEAVQAIRDRKSAPSRAAQAKENAARAERRRAAHRRAAGRWAAE
ncbi:hypothetical protein [Gordonia sp. NPDC003422]